MKILYITTVGGTMVFFNSIIKLLIDEGNVVDIACGQIESIPSSYTDWGCKIHRLSCCRSPLSLKNIKSIYEIKRIVKENDYDIVHCHTPIAAACTRVACKGLRAKGTKVLYTAHGFHFYTGASVKNWLLYYPIEKICSKWTDGLITINQEDFERAKRKLKARKTFYIPGVGIDLTRFEGEKNNKYVREEFSIPERSFLLVSVGELNANKNHSTIIRALGLLGDNSIHYIIAGRGGLEKQLTILSKQLSIESQIHLAGYRDDVPELYYAADVCVFPSIREGQGLAAIEGMACGLPLIVSDNRGTRGFIMDHENALVVKSDDVTGFAEAIKELKDNPELQKKMGENNRVKCAEFDVNRINNQMKEIYQSV